MSARLLRAASAAVLGLGAALVAAPAAVADDVEVEVVIPDVGGLEVVDAQLRWGLNLEAGAGAYFGGCNFLSAGRAGDAGSSRVWSQSDGLWAATDGDVRVEKPDASGTWRTATWAGRCLARDGQPVQAASPASASENQVVLDGGVGSVDLDEGTATVRWAGSFTVAFYGGMTYWSASDPVLTVDADGTGTLTATASGYAASMADAGAWAPVPSTPVTLATLRGVELGADGFMVTPEYLGVRVDMPADGTAQAARDASNAAFWGAFPQDFVRFQARTGQASYWYTSGGARDAAKPATPVAVSWDASSPVPAPVAPPVAAAPAAPVGGASGGSAAAGGASSPVARAVTAASEVASAGPAAAVAALQAATVLAAASLIPAAAAVTGWFVLEGQALAWSVAGLLTAASAAVAGFVKGWLVLPWAR
ncbi:hypothetical protein [Cellulomonas oligotrophica]|uniref:Htaa domain-containing protein n=1 Tax=Cellulomonas oligotrophica TaxID=931536 RepID=A0A7Y9FIN8_9CELL|nr:hypothetical protein [Cellulomonas oligotrophica]NYD87607.1 hypothetical protein [Cellulomonas oligotrophica]GIG33484.1 hypothetical protein Col01nite_26430 [Cellulomonas oligotrophica]